MLSCKSVATRTIITSDGRILGRVRTAMVDGEWRIPLFSLFLERELSRMFHLRRPLLGNPRAYIETGEISALSDNVVLKRRLDELEGEVRTKGEGREATKLLGRRVVGEGGYYFGDLADMSLDQAHWRVSDLLVEVRKKAADDMGFPLTLFGTCNAKVPVKRVESVEKQLYLSMGPDGFKEYIIKEKPRE